jgi:hypothetical protein
MHARGVKDSCATSAECTRDHNHIEIVELMDFYENELRKANKQTNEFGLWRSANFGG